jgi:hypothetical protein
VIAAVSRRQICNRVRQISWVGRPAPIRKSWNCSRNRQACRLPLRRSVADLITALRRECCGEPGSVTQRGIAITRCPFVIVQSCRPA